MAVHPNVDSPTEPGMKSVVTDPIDEYCDLETFWDCLMGRIREPLWPREDAVLKELQLIDHSPEEFTVRVILDGKKLKLLGWMEQLRWLGLTRLFEQVPDGEDFCRFWARVVTDRKHHIVVSTEYDPADGKTVRNVTTTKFLRDPFRIECSTVLQGERKHGPKLATFMQTCYLNPILTARRENKVEVDMDVDSPSGHGKSAMSQALDAYLEADVLFEELVRAIQKADGASNIEYISDTQFELTSVMQTPSLEGQDLVQRQMKQLVRFEHGKEEIVIVSSVDAELLSTCFFRIHRDPDLRVEHWSETGGLRIGGKVEAEYLTVLVNGIIVDMTGGKWFNWV